MTPVAKALLAVLLLCAPLLRAMPPWVSCFAPDGTLIGPQERHTPELSAASAPRLAYAVIEAAPGGPAGCQNPVHLLVAQDGAPFREVFTEAPSTDTGTASSLAPVAWSPDGRWLAVEFGRWYYASDAGGEELLLYDAETQRAFEPEFPGAGCSLRILAIEGFDAENRVRVRMADDEDEEGQPLRRCLAGEKTLTFDPVRRRWSSVR